MTAGRRAAGQREPAPDATAAAEAVDDLRPLLFAIAYRMLGSVTEAEDIVQEAFLRYHRATTSDRDAGGPGDADGPARPESPKAYLSAVTTRLCIDHARSARVRRETYVGQWLPEPVLTDLPVPGGASLSAPDSSGQDPASLAEQADTMSMAFLLLLERLSPVERAVFLLHDVFSYGYDEIAAIVGRSQDACRQLGYRARKHVAAGQRRFEASRRESAKLAERFFAAMSAGDLDGLVSMLAADGRLISVMALEIAGGQVVAARSVINRDKLRHLGPLADMPELVEQSRRADHPTEP